MANEWARAAFVYDAVGLGHDADTIFNAFDSFLGQTGWERASWDSANDRYYLRVDRASRLRWQFNADGPVQYCGIRIRLDTTATPDQFVIHAFLENQTTDGSQISTPDEFTEDAPNNKQRSGVIRIDQDDTAPNTYLIIGGEDGLYVESGRDGIDANLGHGVVLCFDAVTEFHSPLDATVQWTAQGLPADLRGACKFSESIYTAGYSNDRFVTNDGTNRNFTASLMLYSSRGVWDLANPANIQDQRKYLIGPQDNYMTMGSGIEPLTNTIQPSLKTTDLGLCSAFGLLNHAEDSRYRISRMMMVQSLRTWACGLTSAVVGDQPPSSTANNQRDARALRRLLRWYVCSHSLVPWANIVDDSTGLTLRVVRFADNGRISNIAVEWPTTQLTLTL